jgi:hypothetical protein
MPATQLSQNIVSLSKLKAEGTPDEWQVMLGWLLDTHLLIVQLSAHKFEAWLADITLFHQKQGCSQANLDTLIGQLNHTAVIMPMSCHFRGCLHDRINQDAFQKASIKFAKDEMKDLCFESIYSQNLPPGSP